VSKRIATLGDVIVMPETTVDAGATLAFVGFDVVILAFASGVGLV